MKPWTQKEDSVLEKAVRNTPQNLTAAFEIASQELGNHRSVSSVANRYYSKVRKGKPIMALATSQGFMTNTKSVSRRVDQNDEEFNTELALVLLNKLSKEKRQFIIKELLK